MYAKRKTYLTFSDSDNGFHLTLFDSNPPIINFSIKITQDLKILCYKKSSKIPVRELLVFGAQFEHFLQLDYIIEKKQKSGKET